MNGFVFKEVTPENLIGPLNEVERKHAPVSLFVAGDINLCQNYRKVSVIGTREVSDSGILRTRKLVKKLLEKGIVIVSGLARGVDTCAHETAIKNGGKTIAVLGTPLNRFYPKENTDLQKQLMKDHLVISQFKNGSGVHKGNFPLRNRTMALISHATVIVEAGKGSGTLHQGWEALRLGRALFLMQSLTKTRGLEWPREMIQYGAQVLTEERIDVLLDLIPQENPCAELIEMSL